jgi:FdrA protein
MQRIEVVKSTYLDSVSLMRISKVVSDVQGVTNAVVSMATDTNLALMKDIGFDPKKVGSISANDLVIAIEAETQNALDDAFKLVWNQIKGGPGPAGDEGGTRAASPADRPASLDTAIKRYPEINLVLISVPGRYAAYEAHKALRSGKHVMIFSDNVSVTDEKMLKDFAAHHGLLVMGPDCGTAIIGGAALGFANAVPRGRIGIVSASGTGAQEVSSILARLGFGISHIIGTGGRDVSREVGASTMLSGLRALMDDEDTDVIVIISKAPDPGLAERILELARSGSKPCVMRFMGQVTGGTQENLIYASTLAEAALAAAHALCPDQPEMAGPPASWAAVGKNEIAGMRAGLPETGRYVRGLFSGGTLAQEAMFILGPWLGEIHTNMHLRGFHQLDDPTASAGHTILDLGDDTFTRGRAHPMIDQWYRLDRLAREFADPETAVILLDVVLGYGANADPAGEIAGALAELARGAGAEHRMPLVIASICGTRDDPQGYERQRAVLESAGVVMAQTNAHACELVGHILTGDPDGT